MAISPDSKEPTVADKMTIKCNNVARNILNWQELTNKERAEFDYLEEDNDNCFMRYKGWVYDLGEFMRIDKRIAPHPQREGWEKFEGYHSDSFFSGILIKYKDQGCSVIAATYFC